MRKKAETIPVNNMANEFGTGIAIEKFAIDDLDRLYNSPSINFEQAYQSHRHDGHSFFALARGTVELDIDFKRYSISAPSVIYIHPDQVHRTVLSQHVIVYSLALTEEHINPEYSELLKTIVPAEPLPVAQETFDLIIETAVLCLKLNVQRHYKLQRSLLKDSCNTLVGLIVSQYMASTMSPEKLSRYDIINRLFKDSLEINYKTIRRPADYAQNLNISTAYLNECVKITTGYSVSHHIQQRVILEAKRMLYHSNASVKEIAVGLGYDDYPYFSRLFTKITGMSALSFRNKNLA